VCTTSAYHADHADDYDDDDDHGLITLVIDGVQLDLNHTMFTYTDDPVITDVQPATSFVTFVCCCRKLLKTRDKC